SARRSSCTSGKTTTRRSPRAIRAAGSPAASLNRRHQDREPPKGEQMNSALLAFLHHAAAFVLFGSLMVELVLTRSEISLTSARSLLRIDAAYGVSAVLLLVVGFVRVFKTEKGSAYYFGSVPFLIKISLFVIVGLLSIGPTREFLSWRK